MSDNVPLPCIPHGLSYEKQHLDRNSDGNLIGKL